MPDQDRVQKLMEALVDCRLQLDELGAQIAAAHVDTALHALQRQFSLADEVSDTD